MKKGIYIILFSLTFSCNPTEIKEKKLKTAFSLAEKAILIEAKSIMESSYYCTLITQDKKGQPKARVVEPFLPEKEYTVWMATNPYSRKVTQLKNNSKTTLHYFDKSKLAYVSLMGDAYLVDDPILKAQKWKEGWEKFYPKRDTDYLLIKFVPHTLELISPSKKYLGDKTTWKPHQVLLRK
ncbi:MAG: pyridoxamine 5'-phosphate oxidase family protein [Polaribacter sp.]|nr:pyridoxamine 5'-phosphate oxidase family protein [Polaribacter sp.]